METHNLKQEIEKGLSSLRQFLLLADKDIDDDLVRVVYQQGFIDAGLIWASLMIKINGNDKAKESNTRDSS